ncbi:MAG: hypothetical protein ABI480_03390 [Chitinophagaceae bacterium]
MKPLIVLLITFLIALFSLKITGGQYDVALAGRIAMAVMLVFTSIGHFAFTKGMEMMMPEFIPFKKAFVYFTGVLEIVFAIGLLLSNYHVITGWVMIAFFILLLPMNVYAAVRHVNHEKATYDGNGPTYLWFRVPLQILFILWTYFSAINYPF